MKILHQNAWFLNMNSWVSRRTLVWVSSCVIFLKLTCSLAMHKFPGEMSICCGTDEPSSATKVSVSVLFFTTDRLCLSYTKALSLKRLSSWVHCTLVFFCASSSLVNNLSGIYNSDCCRINQAEAVL